MPICFDGGLLVLIIGLSGLLISLVIFLYTRTELQMILSDEKNQIKNLGFEINIAGIGFGIKHLQKKKKSVSRTTTDANSQIPIKNSVTPRSTPNSSNPTTPIGVNKETVSRKPINTEMRDSRVASVKIPTHRTSTPEKIASANVSVKIKAKPRLMEREVKTFPWEIHFHEIKILNKIGEGSFGTVHKGTWCGSFVAVKQPSKDIPAEWLLKFCEEVEMMTLFHHPNIVIFLGACITEPNICLLLEFCERGDMKHFLKTRKQAINTHLLHRFATDVARGMKYLHVRLNLVQRDLKTQNLLVDHNYVVKISDFGLTKKEDNKFKTACGTPYYAAPEVIRGEMYDLSADVYSFAIVLWELVTLDEPYDGMDPLQAAHSAAQDGIRPRIPFVCPDEYAKLMRDCWVDDPSARPTFEEILNTLVDIKKTLYDELKLQHAVTTSAHVTIHGDDKSDGKSDGTKSQNNSTKNIFNSKSHNDLMIKKEIALPPMDSTSQNRSSKSVGGL